MDNNELRQLSQKYLEGTASPEEKQRLNQWYDMAQTGLSNILLVEANESEDAIEQRMFKNLRQNLFKQPAKKQSGLIKRLVIWTSSVAAVLLLFFLVRSHYSEPRNLTPTADHQLVKAPKSRVHLTMPDGSKVVLNAGAVFRYPKKFSNKMREVELVAGRAFFDIKHQLGHPFVVKTKNLNVTVLGTSFDINSNQKDGTTLVTVLSGKVGITRHAGKNAEVLMLLPNQEVLVSNENKPMKKEIVLPLTIKTWYKDDYVYQQENLGKVFKMLEKEYNTKILIENKKLLDEGVTARINNLQPLDTILQILSYTKHFNYQIANDSTVIIK